MVFTGLVQTVAKAFRNKTTWVLRVECPNFFEGCNLGDSIAVNGVCLTLIEGWNKDVGLFFVMEETRSKTNIFAGSEDRILVNLERSLKHGDAVGGHYVLGHVHGTANITTVTVKDDGSRDVWFDLSSFHKEIRHIVHKGCICIDGTSLTVAEIKGNLFRVSLVPHTISHTIFGGRKPGDLVNIEFDYSDKVSPPAGGQASFGTYWSDEDFMNEAIREGEKGRSTAPPNPWVGCVLVKNMKVIGVGHHVKAGQPHAEIMAIRDAEAKGNGAEIQGCTCYVTLEPCHHVGRTPPCDQELVRRAVSRVVVAVADPDHRVNSAGLQYLRDNGIQVTVGTCSDAASNSLKSYLHNRRTGLPFVVVKSAMSLDGRIACSDGTSQWITGEVARKHVHELRAQSQAILVGSGTCLSDNPMLTVRGVESNVKPLRVILDSRGQIRQGHVLDTSQAPTLIFYSDAPQESLDTWKKSGVEFMKVNRTEHGLDPEAILAELGARGILQLLVEGGSQVQSSFIQRHLADSLVLYYGATLIGSEGKSWAQANFTSTISDAKRWKLKKVTQLEDDVCMEYTKN